MDWKKKHALNPGPAVGSKFPVIVSCPVFRQNIPSKDSVGFSSADPLLRRFCSFALISAKFAAAVSLFFFDCRVVLCCAVLLKRRV